MNIDTPKNPYDYWDLCVDIKWVRKHTIVYPVPDPPEIPQYIVNRLTNKLYLKANYPPPRLKTVVVEKNKLEIDDSPYHYWNLTFNIKWVRKNTELIDDVPKPPTIPYRSIELLNDELYDMMDDYLWPEESKPEIFIVGIATLMVAGFAFYLFLQ